MTPARRAFIFILVISAVRLAFLPALDLTPQDAYYWQYSRHLAPGYFDHPPVHAYTAWLTTSIFGDNSFGIRFGPWLYGIGLLILVFKITDRIRDGRAGFWAVVIAGVTPLFSIGSAVLTPDPPLLFFWTLSLYFGHKALSGDGNPWWIPAGFAAGLALLSKYTAVFLFFGFFLILILNKKWRHHFLTPWPYLALIAAFAAFLPQFIWNAQNDWASFAYQSTRRAGEISRWRFDLFAGALGSQILIVSPLLYGGVIWASSRASIKGLFGEKNQNSLFLAAFSLPMIIFFFLIALRYWVKVNWFAPAYVTGAIALAVLLTGTGRKSAFIKWAAGIAALETILLFALVLIPSVPLTGEAAYWEGWTELAERVSMERQKSPKSTFIAGWGYKVPSELAFYLPDKPETHSNEILGFHGLNYSYWTDTAELIGKDCIFVADDREPFRDPKILDKHFENVEKLPPLEPTRGGKKVTTFNIWRCSGYLGP